MICTVSLNPAVDKYIRLPQLRKGEHQEAEEAVTSAGGKAVNVAGVLRALGEEVTLLGFFGGFTGAYLEREIEREGTRLESVPIQALSRTAFVLVEADGTETEIVEPGGRVEANELEELRWRLRRLAAEATLVMLSGSVPPGCPDDVYARLIADCGDHCPVLLDTSRVWLAAALRDGLRKPTVIKPNRREAEELLGRSLLRPDDFAQALLQLRHRGIALPLISDGANGMYLGASEGILGASAPRVPRINSVGSGDAALAGFAAAMARGQVPEDCLRLAVACGTANVLTKECAQVLPGDVERLLPQVQTKMLPRSDARGQS